MRILVALMLAAAHVAYGAEAKEVPAWGERAEAAVQQFVKANAQQLANSIRRIAHPEGRSAELAGFEVLASNDRALVTIRVGWSGTSTRRSHLVRVAWEFTPGRHLNARVTDDSIPEKFAAKRNAELDEHFREQIYPGIARAAKGEK
jgi:hypothetical protein